MPHPRWLAGGVVTRILAIDPGNTHSGWCIIDADTRRPQWHGKNANPDVLTACYGDDPAAHMPFFSDVDHVVIEMIASYGMAVGAELFETCVWIGRFHEAIRISGPAPQLVKRQPVKLHHCHSPRATDSNVRQSLVDRFAPGQRNHGKGTKADPGWFYGFAADVWQAYALAVYIADRQS